MIGLRENFGTAPDDPRGRSRAATELSALVHATFREGGWLQEALRLEHRPQQEQMAQSITNALLDSRSLLFEAGTGVGKSLAYLVPFLVFAHLENRKGIVSSHTIALQEQIKDKDLELCRRLFDRAPQLAFCRDFRTALLVGRGNYICNHRLAQAIASKMDLFTSEEQAELMRIADWAKTSTTGLRHELTPSPHPEVWEWINADSSACNARNCKAETCHYRKARAEVAQAHLLIVNHSLLFALIGAGVSVTASSPGVLFADDFVVLDEAHTIPAIATEYAGVHVSSYGLSRLLRLLYNPRTEKGALRKFGRPEDCQVAEETYDAAVLFFNQIRDAFLLNKPIARIYETPWADPILDPLLTNLSQRLGTCANNVTSDNDVEEIQDLRRRLSTYRGAIMTCLQMEDAEAVYWVERSGRRDQIVHLRSAPLDISAFLRKTVFCRNTAVTLTSATLAEGHDMGAFLRKVGADNAVAVQVQSPFDFDRNMRVFIASDAPIPNKESGALDSEYNADAIAFCAERCRGGSLVLFTSYADLNRSVAMFEPVLTANGRRVLVQGRDGGRMELVRQFQDLGNAVLCGTDSFWTGVDVPGPSLSQVIITRLPFENPSHPIAEARAEWIRARGGSPFFQLTLPDAIVKFRQGIGRLIRNKTDRGTITVLDSRIVHKNYGRRFIDVLPCRNVTRFTRMDRDWTFQPVGSWDD